MAPAKNTEKPSPELKNSSKSRVKSLWAYERGLESEYRVKKFYEAKGFKLLKHRLRTPFAEVDLLFQSPQGQVLMVEVKSANTEDFYLFRVPIKQKKRLERAVLYMSEELGCFIEIHWAFVKNSGEVVVVEDVCG